MCGDICEIDITPSGLLATTEDGVDRFRELGVVLLINAAGIYPEVLTISRSLVRAELYLPPSSLALASARLDILEADLLVIVY